MPSAWRNRLVAAGAGLAVSCSVVGAAPAAADPRDWVPWCTGDQTPANSNCRATGYDPFNGDAPGANPDVPLGLTPGLDPVTGQ